MNKGVFTKFNKLSTNGSNFLVSLEVPLLIGLISSEVVLLSGITVTTAVEPEAGYVIIKV